MVHKKRRESIWEKLGRMLSNIGTLNIILAVVGIFFVWFNWELMDLYRECGSIPESYACAVIAATLGECGICGWIRTSKDKRRDRRWELEDRKKLERGE